MTETGNIYLQFCKEYVKTTFFLFLSAGVIVTAALIIVAIIRGTFYLSKKVTQVWFANPTEPKTALTFALLWFVPLIAFWIGVISWREVTDD